MLEATAEMECRETIHAPETLSVRMSTPETTIVIAPNAHAAVVMVNSFDETTAGRPLDSKAKVQS